MTSSPSRTQLHPLARLIAVAALALAPGATEGQAVIRVGRGSASIDLPVQLTVPARLALSQVGAERVLLATAEYQEVELPVRVAANLSWTVTVGAPGNALPAGVRVRDLAGQWRELHSGVPVPVLTGRDATDPTEMRIQMRLPAGVSSSEALRLRLAIAAGETGGL